MRIDSQKFIETLTNGEIYRSKHIDTTISSTGDHKQTLIYNLENEEFIKLNYDKLKRLGVITEKKIIVE